jgi:large subunit ribosomal protein L21
MYAIIEDSGTQIKVTPGDVVEIDLRPVGTAMGQGEKLTFNRVLLIGDGDKPARIGTPYLAGASVTAEIVTPFLDEKVTTRKYSRRKGYRRNIGHRQALLKVRIEGIQG